MARLYRIANKHTLLAEGPLLITLSTDHDNRRQRLSVDGATARSDYVLELEEHEVEQICRQRKLPE